MRSWLYENRHELACWTAVIGTVLLLGFGIR